ncbi:MAG: succinylglutamate desuccinylase/aspartoacylase family protein [Myxococcota bacterium]|nr:succinylglutamate desuccinylase/aspartoacylase family protein [Myxococcota bacterium]
MNSDWDRMAPSVWRRGGDSPALAVVGSMHGDEAHGAQVIRELLESGAQWASNREVILAIGNPEAVEIGSRGTTPEADLNRLFAVDARNAGDSPEERRCRELQDALQGAASLLDLHQTSCTTPPLAVGPATDEHLAQTARLGLRILVSGVERVYGGGMISEWIDRRGGVGLAVETGQKGTEASLEIARDVTRRFLTSREEETGGDGKVRVYEITEAVCPPASGLRFVRPLGNASSVVAGEVLGTTTGAPLRAPGDGAIFLPREVSGTNRPCLLFARDMGLCAPNVL